jgi:uncharacterized protein (DUF342 family)
MPGDEAKIVELEISPDKLTAAVTVCPTADPQTITIGAILSALGEKRIPVDLAVKERINALLASCAAGQIPTEPVPVVIGTAPVHGEKARLLWPEAFDPARQQEVEENQQVDFYNRTSYIVAPADAILLKIQPPTRGQDGCDVFGETIKARPGKPISITAGPNVTRGGDGHTFTSTAAGRVLFDGRTLSINPVLEVHGAVDFECGNVDFKGDVKVDKGVLDRFRVIAGGDLDVGGPVEGAVVEVGGSAILRGGALMKEKGYVHVLGKVTARTLSNAFVVCGGDLEIVRELLNSTVLTFGKLRVQHGKLAGGLTVALGGVSVEMLGSPSARTFVVAGVDPTLQPKVDQLEAQAEKLTETAEKVRSTVKPLLALGKRLNPEQKEKCTELLFQADDYEMQANDCRTQREQRLEQFKEAAVPRIQVTKQVHADTVVRLGEQSCKIPKDLRGPVTLKLTRAGRASVVTAVWPDGRREPFERNLTPEERRAISDLPSGPPKQTDEPPAEAETPEEQEAPVES